MYGGVYIIDTSSDHYGDEILSLCSLKTKRRIYIPTWEFSILIIHYDYYSGEKINFAVYVNVWAKIKLVLRQNSMDVNGEEVKINLTSNIFSKPNGECIESYLLNLITIKFVYVILDVKPRAVYDIRFFSTSTRQGQDILASIVQFFYAKRFSNYKGRQKNTELFMGSQYFQVIDFIESVFINMSACDIFTLPIWDLRIYLEDNRGIWTQLNTTNFKTLHPLNLDSLLFISRFGLTGPMWFNVHIQRPKYVPHYAVWRVCIEVADGMSYTHMEVLTDSHMSSTVYKLAHRNYNTFYMTVDSGIIFFFNYTDSNKLPYNAILIYLMFMRKPLYDQRTKDIRQNTETR